MKPRIPRPDWYKDNVKYKKFEHQYLIDEEMFNNWFNTHVTPVNEEYAKAIEVECRHDGNQWLTYCESPTHKALLLPLEPIRHESCADVVGWQIDHVNPDAYDMFFGEGSYDRAKAALARSENERE